MSTQRATVPRVPIAPAGHTPPPHDFAGGYSLTARLAAAFSALPLADGEEHPADDIIEAFFDTDASKVYPSELEVIILQSQDADLAAATLQCTARFEPPWSDERKANLVRYCLRADDVCIRDAAVRAAESWPCPDVITELERHRDSVAWLQEYIDEVIADANQLASVRGAQD